MEMLTIGRLAERAGVGVETIRFYERRGLLAAPRRTGSGYRQYAGDEVARLRFIRRAQQLGFSLAEIQELLRLWSDSSTNCGEVRARAERKIQSIDEKIRDLQRVQRALVQLRDSCAAGAAAAACPILAALASDG